MDEQKIAVSFQAVKKDLQEIRNSLEEISSNNFTKLDRKNSEKIFTSKPFVNESMLLAVKEVFESGIFSNGEKTKDFEKKFAEFFGSKYAIAVNNGTVAIEIALLALGIKKGDEVIVPSFTTMPTIEPILRIGAVPVFVDIDEKVYTINPAKIKNAITKKTKAVMPVHIYGNPANLDEIIQICRDYNLFLIEDCAQAHDAKYNGKRVGTFGDIGCFSFYPTKNLTVCGEGGMILTDNQKIYELAKMLVNHGEKIGERYNHVILGNNFRLSEIHCAIGIEQLKLLPEFTKKRREIAKMYDQKLQGKNVVIPTQQQGAEHCYHLYVIRVDKSKRDYLIEKLKGKGIYCGIHYPVPVHMQKATKDLVSKNFKLPVTQNVCKEIISLPIYPELSEEQINKIVNELTLLI